MRTVLSCPAQYLRLHQLRNGQIECQHSNKKVNEKARKKRDWRERKRKKVREGGGGKREGKRYDRKIRYRKEIIFC